MTRGRTGRPAPHRLTIEIADAPDGDGFHVEAGCGCAFPDRTGGHGWAWLGWGSTPERVADDAAAAWLLHRGDVARRFGHLSEHYRAAGA